MESLSTRVINIHGDEFYDVYIGRPSKWGNPYSHLGVPGTIKVDSIEEAIDKYRAMIEQKIIIGAINSEDLSELRGKILGCWCKPGPCHGDVLIEMLEKYD